MEQHKYHIDWTTLSYNPNLTIEFIEKYSCMIDWESLSSNPVIFGHSEHTIKKLPKNSINRKKFSKELEKILDIPAELINIILMY